MSASVLPLFKVEGKMRYVTDGVTITKPFSHEVPCLTAYDAFKWMQTLIYAEGAELIEQKIFEVDKDTGELTEQSPTKEPPKPHIVGLPASIRPAPAKKVEPWWVREDNAFAKEVIKVSTSCMYKEVK